MLVDVPGDDLYGGTLRGKDDGNKPQEGARARGGWAVSYTHLTLPTTPYV